MIRIFDSHAHLSMCQGENILEKALEANVTDIMDIAVDSDSLEKGKRLQKENSSPKILLAAATTPHDLSSPEDPFFPIVKKEAQAGTLSAIGECGLEYFHCPDTKVWQQEVFMRYASLAFEEKLPLIVHCRDAFHTLFSLLKAFPPELTGVIHCFTGTFDEAVALLDKGWYLSFSGIVTFTKSKDLQDVVKRIPMERILVETDAPYLAPQSKRGKPNEPSFITETVSTIATIKGLSFEEVARITFQNASHLFGKPLCNRKEQEAL